MNILNQVTNDRFAIYHADNVELVRGIPDNSIHYTLFSPPFSFYFAIYYVIFIDLVIFVKNKS